MARKKNGKDVPQEMLDSAHRVWLAGLGALSRAEEEGGSFFRRLVEQGEEVESRGRDRVEEVVTRARDTAGEVRRRVERATTRARFDAESRGEELSDQVSRLVDERLDALLRRLGVPSRTEIQSLTERVEQLNRHVERMYGEAGESGGPGKPAKVKSGKPAPKSATPQEVVPEAAEAGGGKTGGAKSPAGGKAKARPPRKTAATKASATKTGPSKARKKKGE